MEKLSNIGTIKDLLNRHGFSFSKALGQNFLINPSVCPRMVQLGGVTAERGVLEIGPGIGVLTAELAKSARKVVAVEIDVRLKPLLQETMEPYSNVEIVYGDAMKMDLFTLIQDKFPGMEVVVCANLPYYITTPLIMRLLEERLPIKSITVMVQKEAAMRLCAKPGTRETGAVTIALQYYAKPKILFPVSRGSFMPSPDVDSAVISLEILPEPPVKVTDEKLFFQIVHAAFAMRRKTLVNCLHASLGLSKDTLGQCLNACMLQPSVRAEQLTMEDFGLLTQVIKKRFDKME